MKIEVCDRASGGAGNGNDYLKARVEQSLDRYREFVDSVQATVESVSKLGARARSVRLRVALAHGHVIIARSAARQLRDAAESALRRLVRRIERQLHGVHAAESGVPDSIAPASIESANVDVPRLKPLTLDRVS